MTVKELIEALQKQDPSEEVCVGNRPIYFISSEPSYWDGPLQVLIQDKANPYYNVKGAKFVRSGSKVQVHILTIEDALLEDPDMPVECGNARDEALVAQWRKEAKEARGETNA